MPISDSQTLSLSVVVTVVGGKELVARCLNELCNQIDFRTAEVIVPYDQYSKNVGDLATQFSQVQFHYTPSDCEVRPIEHDLYDRRRAAGLNIARGRVVAMTEDYAVPAKDWCSQILACHEQDYPIIGGAIDNEVDHPLNWALYYCDFGRYGRPLAPGEAKYASDVNIAYKRDALNQVRSIWRESYQETSVNWGLQALGKKIFLDPRMLVFENRPTLSVRDLIRERIQWGRVFARTRIAVGGGRPQRVLFAAVTPFLPLLLLARVCKHMLRQHRSAKQVAQTLPWASLLLFGWAIGEFAGYVFGAVSDKGSVTQIITDAQECQRT